MLCSGNRVSDVIQNRSVSDIKSKLFKYLGEIDSSITPNDLVQVSPLGKNKKILKVTCSDIKVKNNILKNARIHKLPNIFFGEFLTPLRNEIFYKLRQLKRNNADKIKAVYTRNGNVYYKLTNCDEYKLVRSLGDINSLMTELQSG